MSDDLGTYFHYDDSIMSFHLAFMAAENRNKNKIQYVTDRRRHLICIPYSIENLHKMAEELDIKRCWFHKDHYDIPKQRVQEIEDKCMIVSSKDIVRIVKG